MPSNITRSATPDFMSGTLSSSKLTGAPSFEKMVRDNGPITLGEAKQFARTLPAEQQNHKCCACKKVVCSTGHSCCPGSCVCCTTNVRFGKCLWYGQWFCACKSNANPGTFSCTDLKGNIYNLVKVDGEKDKWAWFTENEYTKVQGDDLKVSCYCE